MTKSKPPAFMAGPLHDNSTDESQRSQEQEQEMSTQGCSMMIQHRRRTKRPTHCFWRHCLFASLLVTTIISPAHSQPTFDECKIFLVASDTARDGTLNRDPEYIRFLNLVARTYTNTDNLGEFDTYDNLPVTLQSIYKAYAWTKYYEIDINAAMFGAVTSDEEVEVLRAFCDETAESIESLIETEAPTFAPTLAPTFPGLSFDKDTIDDQPQQQLVMSMSTAIADLPIQCRRAMFGSDNNPRDGFLTKDEYTMFANRLTTNSYAHAATFNDLPNDLQTNFDNLMAESGEAIDVFGAVPSQWADATPQQRAFLQLICYRTEAALLAAHEAHLNHQNQTTTLLPQSQTLAPTTDSQAFQNATSTNTNVTTNNATASQGNNITPNENEKSSDNPKNKLTNNEIAAIVGSILIVILGLYMARDKQDRVREICVGAFRKLQRKLPRRPRRQGRIAGKITPAGSNDTEAMTGHDSKHDDLHDSEFLQEHELTGILEDPRVVGNSNSNMLHDVETGDNKNNNAVDPTPRRSDGSSGCEFQTVRFTPDEFNTSPFVKGSYPVRFNPDDFLPDNTDDYFEGEDYQDQKVQTNYYDNDVVALDTEQESVINPEFFYDEFSEEDSSTMSLYCNSEAAEEEALSDQTPSPKKADNTNQLGGDNNGDDPLLEEKISSPRRGTATLYHASRFGQISKRESKSDSFSTLRTNEDQQSTSARGRRRISGKTRKLGGSSQHQKGKAPRGRRLGQKARKTSRYSYKNSSEHNSEEEPKTSKLSTQPGMEDVPKVPKRHSPIQTKRNLVDQDEEKPSSSSKHGMLRRHVAPPKCNEQGTTLPADTDQSDNYGDDDIDVTSYAEIGLNDVDWNGRAAGNQRQADNMPQINKSENTIRAMFMRTFLGDNRVQETSLPTRTVGQTTMYADDESDGKPVDVERSPLMVDETFSLGSVSTSHHPDSPDTSSTSKDFIRGDSDSTYYGTEDETCSTIPKQSFSAESFDSPTKNGAPSCGPSRSLRNDGPVKNNNHNPRTEYNTGATTTMSATDNRTEEAAIQEIHELVKIVMPTEQDKVSQMLAQYKGRETMLLQTLRRLEARSSARRTSGRAICANDTITTRASDSQMSSSVVDAKEVLRRSSVVSQNAELLAMAATGTGFHRDEASVRSEQTMFFLESSSESSLEEDEYSRDSTYVEQQRSLSFNLVDDESWSIAADLR